MFPWGLALIGRGKKALETVEGADFPVCDPSPSLTDHLSLIPAARACSSITWNQFSTPYLKLSVTWVGQGGYKDPSKLEPLLHYGPFLQTPYVV